MKNVPHKFKSVHTGSRLVTLLRERGFLDCITGDKFHAASSFTAAVDLLSRLPALTPVWHTRLPSAMMGSCPSETESQNKQFHKLLLILVFYHSSKKVINTEAKKKSYLTLKTKVKR